MKKFLVKALLRIVSVLPLGVHHLNAHIVGWLTRVVVRYRRKIVWDNIDKAFPEKTLKDKKKIFRGFYLHFGQIITEAIWFGGSSARRIKRSKIATVVNPDELDRIAALPGSAMFVFAHCGNWEILPGFPWFDYGGQTPPLTAENTVNVYKRLSDPVWEDIMKYNRIHALGSGYERNYVESSSILRHVLEHKEEKLNYFFCTDQWPYGISKGWTVVDFMHRKTRSMTAAAALARKLGMSVVYLSIRRGKGHKKYILELKTIADDARTLSEQQIIDQYYKYIEEDICADPANYLWSHRRWHKMPENEE